MCIFRTAGQKYTDLGFGSVYDGSEQLGQFANLSTQAVMSLIKNISDCDNEPSQVVLGTFEVDEFCIPANVEGEGRSSHILGKVKRKLWNK